MWLAGHVEYKEGMLTTRVIIVWKTKQDRQCTYNVTLRRVRLTIVAVEKAVSITQPECVYL